MNRRSFFKGILGGLAGVAGYLLLPEERPAEEVDEDTIWTTKYKFTIDSTNAADATVYCYYYDNGNIYKLNSTTYVSPNSPTNLTINDTQ